MKYPNTYEVKQLVRYALNDGTQVGTYRGWVPARPEGYPSLRSRVYAAWLVFTGQADAVVWPGGQ